MIKRHKKKWMIMISIIIVVVLLNVIEWLFLQQNIKPRVLVGELKGCLIWLAAPFTIIGLLFSIFYDELQGESKVKQVINQIVFFIAIFVIFAVAVVRGLVYCLSGGLGSEQVHKDGIIEVQVSPLGGGGTITYEEPCFLFFRRPFEGYSDEENEQRLKQRYGETAEIIAVMDNRYTVELQLDKPVEGKISFFAKKEYELENNLKEEIYYYLGNSFFEGKEELFYWKQSSSSMIEGTMYYNPVFICRGKSDEEIRKVSTNIADFTEFCLQNDILYQNRKYFITTFHVEINSEELTCWYLNEYDMNEFDKETFREFCFQEIKERLAE